MERLTNFLFFKDDIMFDCKADIKKIYILTLTWEYIDQPLMHLWLIKSDVQNFKTRNKQLIQIMAKHSITKAESSYYKYVTIFNKLTKNIKQ